MRNDEKKKVHENLKQEIRSLLISSPKTKYGGLTGSLLYFDYKQLNCGKEVPCKLFIIQETKDKIHAELGFHSFLSLLRSMPDVVRIEYKENSPSYRVHPVYNESTAHIQKMVCEQRDKYQHQNELYNQNWYSNQQVPNNFSYNNQFPFFHNYLSYHALNSVEKNSSVFHNSSHRKLRQIFPRNSSVLNKQKIESNLLLTPIDDTKQDKKKNNLSCLSSNHEICSTPNTFRETPPNFDFDDYYLNESIPLTEKDIHEENNINSSVNNQLEQIQDDPLLTTSIDLEKISIKNEIIFENSISNEQSKTDENNILIKRLNDAIRQCIDFRYIHRLCEIKFEYRHYPLSNDILLIKSKLEEKAFNQYQQELKDFQNTSRLNSIIDDEKCQIMFNQYISLQRNYYYMIKLMNKKHK